MRFYRHAASGHMRTGRLMTVLAAATVALADPPPPDYGAGHMGGADSAQQPSCRSGFDCASLAANRSAVVTVGARGADCSSIQAAVNCAPTGAKILITPGVYREQVILNKTGIQLLGQAPMAMQNFSFSLPSSRVVVTWPVPNQPVLNVTHDDVIISNITSFNDANHFQIGKNSGLYITSGDRTAVYFSSFFGAQDTVYTGKQRAYLFGCRVNGTTDFNYGQGAAVYDECVLVGERAGNFYNGQSFLTATTGNVTGSTPENPAVRSAYLVRNSQLPASPRIGRTYLGRPWGDGATVIYDNVWMDKHIDADGWCPQNNWRKIPCNHNSTACADTYYAEHNSSGPGGSPNGRVAWSHQLTQRQVKGWTPQRVLRGWIPPPAHAFVKWL